MKGGAVVFVLVFTITTLFFSVFSLTRVYAYPLGGATTSLPMPNVGGTINLSQVFENLFSPLGAFVSSMNSIGNIVGPTTGASQIILPGGDPHSVLSDIDNSIYASTGIRPSLIFNAIIQFVGHLIGFFVHS